ncbi:MAG TPA: TlpA disulfide reductase family protein, partial [Burkholderiaceae bacterium]|nr:TlpA disulfide reductase family protein [Burkholderiaceae bacterium]
ASAIDQLFTLTLPDPSGQPQALGQWRGRPLILNFWATWCAPCVEEMPELQRLHDVYSPKGAHVLGLAVDRGEAVAEFARKLAIRYPLLIAGASGADLARALGNAAGGLPFTLAIRADGQLHASHVGKIRYEQAREWLDQLTT